jgi:hypothetical protein
VASRLNFEHVGAHRLDSLLSAEFESGNVSDKAWAPAVESVIARLATSHHLVLSFAGCEFLFPRLTTLARYHITATEDRRVGNIMLERRLERAEAKLALRELEAASKELRRRRFVKSSPEMPDLTLNASTLLPEQIAGIIVTAFETRGPAELLTAQAEAQLRFQSRLQLASHGITANGKAKLPSFVHPSEETFANLLDFYRVAWDYEPRSFPLQWDKDGNVVEAFTPDFYLPEFDLYVELTTMKQALVTRKNRKIKLLKAIYPHVNIQIFYQKDYQDLIEKYGILD